MRPVGDGGHHSPKGSAVRYPAQPQPELALQLPRFHLFASYSFPRCKRAGFHGIFISGRLHSKVAENVGYKPPPGGIHDQLMEQRPSYRAGFALDITLGTLSYTVPTI